MGQHDLLKALGRLERERRHEEQRDPWRALTEGALSSEERHDLEARAGRTDEGRRLRALATPVGEDLADRLLVRMAAEQLPTRSAGGWLRGLGFALGLTTLLALTLYIGQRGDDPPLPGYAVEVTGGDARVRGAEVAVAERSLAADSVLDVSLRPEVPVGGEVALRVFVRDGEALRAATVEAVASAQGAFRFGGRVAPLLGIERPGAYEVVAVVGRPGRLPASPAEVTGALDDPEAAVKAGWQVFRVPFTLTPPR